MIQQNLNAERTRQLYVNIEKYEDAGYGCCILSLPEVQQILVSSLGYISQNSASLFAYVIMPNHIHMLLQPRSRSLSGIMTSFKQVTGHAINKALQREGPVWEREYFDRFVRDAGHFTKSVKYIFKNNDSMIDKSLLWIDPSINVDDIAAPNDVRYHPGVRSTNEKDWINHRSLNHFDEIGICQFVTLRLCDAVPASVIMKWRAELGIARAKKSSMENIE